jgi:hypothetical protein
MITPAAFYCVSSSEYFLGAVAMINSLRLAGHTEPIFVLDCGLAPDQLQLLEAHTTVVTAPDEAPPFMLKTVAPLRHPAEVMVLIDADMVVNRSLAPLVERAARGRVIAPRLPIDRFFPEWGELLGLGPARPGPYVTSGLVLLGGSTGYEVLRLMDGGRARVELDRTFGGNGSPDYPFHYADQDLLNAILASGIDRSRIESLESRLVATIPFRGITEIDDGSLRCAYEDGLEPYVAHHVFGAKPWLEPTPDGLYPRLLRRALLCPNGTVKVPRTQIPLRLRTGLFAAVERKRVLASARLRWHLGEPLSARIRTARARSGNQAS